MLRNPEIDTRLTKLRTQFERQKEEVQIIARTGSAEVRIYGANKNFLPCQGVSPKTEKSFG